MRDTNRLRGRCSLLGGERAREVFKREGVLGSEVGIKRVRVLGGGKRESNRLIGRSLCRGGRAGGVGKRAVATAKPLSPQRRVLIVDSDQHTAVRGAAVPPVPCGRVSVGRHKPIPSYEPLVWRRPLVAICGSRTNGCEVRGCARRGVITTSPGSLLERIIHVSSSLLRGMIGPETLPDGWRDPNVVETTAWRKPGTSEWCLR